MLKRFFISILILIPGELLLWLLYRNKSFLNDVEKKNLATFGNDQYFFCACSRLNKTQNVFQSIIVTENKVDF